MTGPAEDLVTAAVRFAEVIPVRPGDRLTLRYTGPGLMTGEVAQEVRERVRAALGVECLIMGPDWQPILDREAAGPDENDLIEVVRGLMQVSLPIGGTGDLPEQIIAAVRAHDTLGRAR